MYFLPRNNRIYSALVHTKPGYRYLITISILSITIYSWYVGIYSTINQKILRYTSDINRLQQHLDGQQSKQDHKKLESSLHTLQEELKPYKIIPAPERMQASILTFLETMQKNGLLLVSCSLEKEQTQTDYSSIDLNGSFVGSLEAFIKGMQALPQAHVLLTWNNLTLTAESKNKTTITFSVTLTSLSN